MWRTNIGTRVLEPAESRVFREAAGHLLDDLTDKHGEGEDTATGILVFDRLPLSQRIALLAVVCEGLLRSDAPPPELTAVNEGSIAAVFAYMQLMVSLEVDATEVRTTLRSAVADACNEAKFEDVPDPSCTDHEEWECFVGMLSDTILWDADYEDDGMQDHHPAASGG